MRACGPGSGSRVASGGGSGSDPGSGSGSGPGIVLAMTAVYAAVVAMVGTLEVAAVTCNSLLQAVVYRMAWVVATVMMAVEMAVAVAITWYHMKYRRQHQ